MLDAKEVKKLALALGADMAGIGNIERWEGAPAQMDPRQIMPEARSVIGLVFRVMRGSLRGVEEGTLFSNYSAMGYGGITYLYMPLVVVNLCRHIEDEGHEALPMGHQSDWRGIDNVGGFKADYSRPVAPGRARPDVMIHLRIAAFLCGLGEIGYSKLFLSPRFGPRNRVGVVITEAELEPDPIYDGPALCDRCMACVARCPGKAIGRERTVKLTLPRGPGGREIEWGEIDCEACDIAFRGGMPLEEGAAGREPPENDYASPMFGKRITRAPWTPFYRKPRNLYNTGQAVCGGRGCVRECMIRLERRGVLGNRFRREFRRRKPWGPVDWSAPQGPPGTEGAGTPPGGEAD